MSSRRGRGEGAARARRARASGDGLRAHVSPVDLGLLPDEALGPEVHLAARDRPHLGHVTMVQAALRENALDRVVVPPDHHVTSRRSREPRSSRTPATPLGAAFARSNATGEHASATGTSMGVDGRFDAGNGWFMGRWFLGQRRLRDGGRQHRGRRRARFLRRDRIRHISPSGAHEDQPDVDARSFSGALGRIQFRRSRGSTSRQPRMAAAASNASAATRRVSSRSSRRLHHHGSSRNLPRRRGAAEVRTPAGHSDRRPVAGVARDGEEDPPVAVGTCRSIVARPHLVAVRPPLGLPRCSGESPHHRAALLRDGDVPPGRLRPDGAGTRRTLPPERHAAIRSHE